MDRKGWCSWMKWGRMKLRGGKIGLVNPSCDLRQTMSGNSGDKKSLRYVLASRKG